MSFSKFFPFPIEHSSPAYATNQWLLRLEFNFEFWKD